MSMAERAKGLSEKRSQSCKICSLMEVNPGRAEEIREMVDDPFILASVVCEVLMEEFGVSPARSSVKPHREGRCGGVFGRRSS